MNWASFGDMLRITGRVSVEGGAILDLEMLIIRTFNGLYLTGAVG